MITNKIIFNTPSTNNRQKNIERISNPSISFGLNITPHAKQRMKERNITIKDIIATMKEGRKFFVVEKQKRIVSLRCENNKPVAEGSVYVVTDKTGNNVISVTKTYEGECEVDKGVLIKKSHRKRDNVRFLESWSGKFDDKIFKKVKFMKDPNQPNPISNILHKVWDFVRNIF